MRDRMAEHFEHDARDYPGMRPKEVDDALTADLKRVIGGFDNVSSGIEGIKKRNWGTLLLAFGVLAVAFEFGIWVTNYNRNAADGSPALVKLDQKLTKQNNDTNAEFNSKLAKINESIAAIAVKDDARYDKLNEILIRVSTIQEQQSQRLDRVEGRGK